MSDELVAPLTIDAVISALNSRDPQQIVTLYALDATFEEIPVGTPVRGHAAIAQMFTELFAAFPDFVMTAGKRAEQGEALFWEWIVTGTHQGAFSGIEPTGNAIQLRGVSFCCARGGKITEQREYWDLNTLTRQLQAAP